MQQQQQDKTCKHCRWLRPAETFKRSLFVEGKLYSDVCEECFVAKSRGAVTVAPGSLTVLAVRPGCHLVDVWPNVAPTTLLTSDDASLKEFNDERWRLWILIHLPRYKEEAKTVERFADLFDLESLRPNEVPMKEVAYPFTAKTLQAAYESIFDIHTPEELVGPRHRARPALPLTDAARTAALDCIVEHDACDWTRRLWEYMGSPGDGEPNIGSIVALYCPFPAEFVGLNARREALAKADKELKQIADAHNAAKIRRQEVSAEYEKQVEGIWSYRTAEAATVAKAEWQRFKRSAAEAAVKTEEEDNTPDKRIKYTLPSPTT